MQQNVGREAHAGNRDSGLGITMAGCPGAALESEFDEFEKFICSAFITRAGSTAPHCGEVKP
jgi:hypothetical protein